MVGSLSAALQFEEQQRDWKLLRSRAHYEDLAEALARQRVILFGSDCAPGRSALPSPTMP